MEKFKIPEIVSLINLLNSEIKGILNYSKLSKLLGYGSSDKRFLKIKNYLLEIGAIIEVDMIGGSKILELNKKILKEQLPELKFLKFLHEEFIKKAWGEEAWKYKK